MSLGTNIRYRRVAMGWTQEQLAARIGIAATRVSEYERGRHKPREETLEWIAGALDCRVADLYTPLALSVELPRRIRRRRKALKLSQAQLGELVGVSLTTMSRWELGYEKPGRKNLLALAEALGCRVEDLI